MINKGSVGTSDAIRYCNTTGVDSVNDVSKTLAELANAEAVIQYTREFFCTTKKPSSKTLRFI